MCSADTFPSWAAPLIGLAGVLVGLVVNNFFTYFDERRRFKRDKKLELHLDLQDEEYEMRRWADAVEKNKPVEPDWLALNRRWSSLLFRLGAFATPTVREASRLFYDSMHSWLEDAEKATRDHPLTVTKQRQLIARADKVLAEYSSLYLELRHDLKVPLV